MHAVRNRAGRSGCRTIRSARTGLSDGAEFDTGTGWVIIRVDAAILVPMVPLMDVPARPTSPGSQRRVVEALMSVALVVAVFDWMQGSQFAWGVDSNLAERPAATVAEKPRGVSFGPYRWVLPTERRADAVKTLTLEQVAGGQFATVPARPFGLPHNVTTATQPVAERVVASRSTNPNPARGWVRVTEPSILQASWTASSEGLVQVAATSDRWSASTSP